MISITTLQVRTVYLIIWFWFFYTRRETILKSLSYHTMLTTPPTLSISRGPFSVSQHDGQTPTVSISLSNPFLTIMVGPQLLLSAIEADNRTVCLYGPKSNSQLILFKNLQILSTIASGHDIIPTSSSFSIWGLLW